MSQIKHFRTKQRVIQAFIYDPGFKREFMDFVDDKHACDNDEENAVLWLENTQKIVIVRPGDYVTINDDGVMEVYEPEDFFKFYEEI